jgi:flagellar basal body P-ring formation protein FlgA
MRHLLFSINCIVFLLFANSLLAIQINNGNDVINLVTESIIAKGASKDIKVKINEIRPEDVVAGNEQNLTGELDALEIDKKSGRFTALLITKDNGRNLAPFKISGNYDEMMEVPMLKRQVKSDDVILSEDIYFDKQPARKLRDNVITDNVDLVGKSPKRLISANRPIRKEEISLPFVMTKNKQITIMYKTTNIEIKTLGEAMENGAVGDIIKVKNLTSKQVISGKIESSEVVRVTSLDDNN